MKKRSVILFILAVGIGTIAALPATPSTARFEGMLEEAYAVEMVMTFESQSLFHTIEEEMYRDFSKVERVDLHQSHFGFPYYTIYGVDSEGNDHLAMVKVSETDVQATTFSYTYCQWGICVSSYATGPCKANTRFGIQCGCYDCNTGGCNVF
ncbi:MAG TPA: hypothetical protein DCE41_04265 [Cytophagales bacterium]|nr:hypothetical protein [Cytophagales bacterium]HAA20742.1 hypothetical protein [Cytophagales bacterium]HAP62331.1 hypothetical protein [Cytophagales bacterium]